MNKIIIKDLIVHALIGVHAHEKKAKQPLSIDFAFSVNIERAALTDAIVDTYDYSAIYESIIVFVEQTPCNLIETLAKRLMDHLKTAFQLSWVQLIIIKHPSSMPQASGVSVMVEG